MIPFSRPYITGKELEFIDRAFGAGRLSGDGQWTKKCQSYMEAEFNFPKVLVTHSCTGALEMAALLANIEPGDEVIMPSFTFVSTANAFVLRGAKPVFVDIRPDTLNLDERKIEEVVTKRTKAIAPVHYAGVACEMDQILSIAKEKGLFVIEDAAQGYLAKYKDRFLGGLGHFGAYSFHDTKNIISGEGGALIVNSIEHLARAEIIREKGTDRSQFLRGQVDKYTWQDVGSSFLTSEVTCALLWAQLEMADQITGQRHTLWNHYQHLFEDLESSGRVRRPFVPSECTRNAHIYYLLLNERYDRGQILQKLREVGIQATSHYEPLHCSPFGKKVGITRQSLEVTNLCAAQILRLPMWVGLERGQQDFIAEVLTKILN